MSAEETQELVDHLFRHEFGKMVATLTRIYGFQNLEMVEDVVQDTFIKALRSWREKVPANPPAWLMLTAKNRAIDVLRRGKLGAQKVATLEPQTETTPTKDLFLDHEIEDSQLRMIFACCAPELKQLDQIALNLQLVCGFGHKEIGKALFLNPETVKKRVQRAKQKLRDSGTELTIPNGAELIKRNKTALTVLYLIFNEGYYSSNPDEPIKRELCAEAMRLTKMVCHHELTNTSAANALMALMCYHASRFKSRSGEGNTIVLLKDQDRSLWQKELVEVGHWYFARGNKEEPMTMYHLEAAIALQHCSAPTYEATNWKSLKILYTSLYNLTGNPVVLLNKAVVMLEADELLDAFELVKSIDEEELKGSKHLYHAVLAKIFKQMDDEPMFLHHRRQSAELTNNASEKALFENL